MKKSRILVVALSLMLILNTATYAVAGLEVGTAYGVAGTASVSELPQELSVITCPAGNLNTSGAAYNLAPQVVGTASWGKYLFVAIQNYNISNQNAAHANQLAYKTYINVYDTTAENPLAQTVACYDTWDLAGDTSTQAWGMVSYINGIYIDEDNFYVVAADLKASPHLHTYKNPLKDGVVAETLEKTNCLKLIETGTSVVFRNWYKDYVRPVKLDKVSYGEREYLIVNYKAVAIAKNSEFPAISVADVTNEEATSVAKSVYLSDIKTDEFSISRYYEMDFDGTDAYIVGANMGTIDNTKLTSDETIDGGYYALFKVDFSDPTNPEVKKAWKICDIKYKWLYDVRGTGKTADINQELYMVPSLEINDGVIVTSLYRAINDANNLYAQLGGLAQAYIVKSNDETMATCTPYSFRVNNVAHTFGANIIYANGVYYLNLSTHHQAATVINNQYTVKTEAEFLAGGYFQDLVEIGVESVGQQAYAVLSNNIVVGDNMYSFYQYPGRSDVIAVETDLSRTRELESVTSITTPERYYATVTVNNTTESTVVAVPVTALYDATGLIVDYFVGKNISVDASKTAETELFVTVPTSDDYSGYTLKTYLFNNLTKISPLCNSMSIVDSVIEDGEAESE